MKVIKNLIIDNINLNDGYITLDKFINTSMYDQKYGYYIRKNPIGKVNDFITSPEISQLFGEIIGLYIIDYWKNYINKDFNIVELGPGQGTMMQDILRVSAKYSNYLVNLNLKLIEKNKILIKNQKKLLGKEIKNLKSIEWLDDINKFLNTNETIFIANEFFDCFPVKQIYKYSNNYYESVVKYDLNKRHFFIDKIELKKNNSIINKVKNIFKKNKYKDGHILEISEQSDQYINKISEIVLKNNGLIILIDYGNFYSTGYSTLKSIKNHKNLNILDNPGEQDISYMIDFAYISSLFYSKKLYVYGPFFQGDFFTALGINKRKDRILKNTSINNKQYIEDGVNKIIDNNKMGKLFKVLIASSRKLKLYEE